MPDDRELAVLHARQKWWIRVFYLTDSRKPKLSDVAEAAGLKAGSASVVSKWMSTGPAVPKYRQLVQLAAYFKVPLSALTEPDPTDEERAAEFRRLALGAVDAALADSEAGEEEPHPELAFGPESSPRRRSA